MYFSGMLIKFLSTMCITNALSLTTPTKNVGRSSNNHMITREAESPVAKEEKTTWNERRHTKRGKRHSLLNPLGVSIRT